MTDEAAESRGPATTGTGPSQDAPAPSAAAPEPPPAYQPPPAASGRRPDDPPPPPPPGAGPPPWFDSGSGPSFSREKLVRPVQGRYIAGVCGALGRATNTDPVLWRVLLAVLGFFGGVGVLIYLLGWLLIPAENDSASPIESLLGRGRSGMKPLSIVLLGGAAVLTFAFVVNDGFRAALLAVAVIAGAAVLLKRNTTGGGAGRSVSAGPGAPQPTSPVRDRRRGRRRLPGRSGARGRTGRGTGDRAAAAPSAAAARSSRAAQFAPPTGGYRPPFAPHGPWAGSSQQPYAAAPPPPSRRSRPSRPGRSRSWAGSRSSPCCW